MTSWLRWGLACAPLWLAACAVTPPPPRVEAPVPPTWQAPLPHGGTVAALSAWWATWDDPLLVELIERAQALSPGVAQAGARLAQARAAQQNARAALLPTADAQVNLSRGFNLQLGQVVGTALASAPVSWEADLWGGLSASARAAQDRTAGALAQWHEARVSVAAEVALQYRGWRACLVQLDVAERDARSRAETARLSDASERAGFTPPATAALARASAAEGQARATQQRMQCAVDLKTLVALTGMDEPLLRERAASPAPQPPQDLLSITALPAQVLAQRPDVYGAEREVAAASADVGAAQAQRYPRLSLQGSVGGGALRLGGENLSITTWSLGPLAVSVPLFDGGRRRAQVDAAQARYDEAVALYRARVRQAVSEVEQALVRLQATAERRANAETAAQGYQASLQATEARWRAGLASQVELEDARRTALAAHSALVTLQLERESAWIALYRAAGGGWEPPASPAAQAARGTAP